MGTELTDGSNDDDDDDDDDVETSSLPTNYGSSSNDYGLGGPQLLSGGGKAGVAVVALVCVGAVVGGVAFYLIRRGWNVLTFHKVTLQRTISIPDFFPEILVKESFSTSTVWLVDTPNHFIVFIFCMSI